MKRKNKIIAIAAIVSAFLILLVCVIMFISKLPKRDIPKENTYAQLVNELTQTEAEGLYAASEAFMNNISYDITQTNEEEQTADIEVSVPVFGDTYNTIIEQVVKDNPDAAYAELLELTKKEIADSLNNGEFETKTETLTVSYQEIDGEMRIIPSDAFFDFVSEELYEMYFDMLVESAGGTENDEN